MKNTERFINNWDFFLSCEPELELHIKEKPEYNIHIWKGHLRDIFGKPRLDGMGWHGFTLDYQEDKRTAELDGCEIKDIDEYIDDLLEYKDKGFEYEETNEVYCLMLDFLQYAKENNLTVVGTLEF